jgi:hypothetical protein
MGRMNYHLRQLQGLIERDGERRYRLTPLGEQTLSVLNYMTEDPNGKFETYLNRARISQSAASIQRSPGSCISGWLLIVSF